MKTVIAPDPARCSTLAAQALAGYVRQHPGALVCLAAGNTPLKVFRELVALQESQALDLRGMRYIGLDEWVGLGPGDQGSCVQVMREAFYGPAGIPEDRLFLWDGQAGDLQAEIARGNAFLRAHGPVGLTLLGIGMNGHVGFNEPGCAVAAGGMVTPLDEVTRQVSVKYFDRPRAVSQGIGLGLGSLLQADRVLLMAHGAHKADIVRKALEGPPGNAVPASLFQHHKGATLYLDEAAAGLLERRDG
ncbi:MAG: glucosamine-6-phosphate deaminase [Clostridiales bacterium]|nr:glucosamine-6-phosphate deaminase [Clostridiales bacterium]